MGGKGRGCGKGKGGMEVTGMRHPARKAQGHKALRSKARGRGGGGERGRERATLGMVLYSHEWMESAARPLGLAARKQGTYQLFVGIKLAAF